MKRVLLVVGLGFLAGSLYASCMGPFCWDESGAYINGVLQNGNGTGIVTLTKAQEATQVPSAKGQLIWCSDCLLLSGQKGYLCVSTGTTSGSYMAVSSATAVTGCQ